MNCASAGEDITQSRTSEPFAHEETATHTHSLEWQALRRRHVPARERGAGFRISGLGLELTLGSIYLMLNPQKRSGCRQIAPPRENNWNLPLGQSARAPPIPSRRVHPTSPRVHAAGASPSPYVPPRAPHGSPRVYAAGASPSPYVPPRAPHGSPRVHAAGASPSPYVPTRAPHGSPRVHVDESAAPDGLLIRPGRQGRIANPSYDDSATTFLSDP